VHRCIGAPLKRGRELLIVLPYGNPLSPLLEELKKRKKNF
jgi:hypothetical protein